MGSYSYSVWPKSSNFFSQTTIVPVIAFHGIKAKVFNFPYINQNVYFSAPPPSGTDYNKETRCLLNSPYQLETSASTIDATRGSSLNIYDILKNASINKSVELYTDCDMKHGVDEPGTYFGTSYTSANVHKYMVQRSAIFFQAIMNGIDINLGQDRFDDQ